MLVGVLAHHILELLGILGLFLLPLVQVVGLNLLVLLEQLLDLRLVAIENGRALAIELSLYLVQLQVVVFSHLVELVLHPFDQRIDVLRHLLNRLDVVAVLLVDLTFELFDELLLVRDDLGASSLLGLYVL